ncbi:MAG: hypothetical protein WCG10_00185 [Chlamydiota bacterium]
MSAPIDTSPTNQASLLSSEIKASGFFKENITLKKTEIFCRKIFAELTATSDPTSTEAVKKNLTLIKHAITTSKNRISSTRKKIDRFLTFISFGLYQSKEIKLNHCLQLVSNELAQITKQSQENIKKSYQEFRALELTETPKLFKDMVDKTEKQGILSITCRSTYFDKNPFSSAFIQDIDRSHISFIDEKDNGAKIDTLTIETATSLLTKYPELSALSLIINQSLPISLLRLFTESDPNLENPIFTIANISAEKGGVLSYTITKKTDGSYVIKNTISFEIKRFKYVSDFHQFPEESWSFTLTGEIKLSQNAVEKWIEDKKDWDKPEVVDGLADLQERYDELTNTFLKEHQVSYSMEMSDPVLIMSDDSWNRDSRPESTPL